MNIEFDRAISEMVEHFLPRSSRDDLFLIVPVEIKLWNKDNNKSAYKKVFLLFHRNSNYTKVCMAESDSFDPISIKEWTLESYHDSCWRSDGFSSLRKIYDDMTKDLFYKSELSSHISFGLTGLGYYQGEIVIDRNEHTALIELKKKYHNFDITEKIDKV